LNYIVSFLVLCCYCLFHDNVTITYVRFLNPVILGCNFLTLASFFPLYLVEWIREKRLKTHLDINSENPLLDVESNLIPVNEKEKIDFINVWDI